jgi:hypothetical protein
MARSVVGLIFSFLISNLRGAFGFQAAPKTPTRETFAYINPAQAGRRGPVASRTATGSVREIRSTPTA